MGKEDFDNYLAKRFEPQVAWYDRKATRYKNYYHWLQWTIVITSAIVPPMIVWMPEDYKLVTVIPSIALTIATSSQKVFKFQEHWINYRAIAEALKKRNTSMAPAQTAMLQPTTKNNYLSKEPKQLCHERTCRGWISKRKQNIPMKAKGHRSKKDRTEPW